MPAGFLHQVSMKLLATRTQAEGVARKCAGISGSKSGPVHTPELLLLITYFGHLHKMF